MEHRAANRNRITRDPAGRPRLSALPLAAALGLSLTLAACGDAQTDDGGNGGEDDAGSPTDGQEGGDQTDGDQEDADQTDDGEQEDGEGSDGGDAQAGSDAFAAAELQDAAGNAVGTVSFTEIDGGTEVHADVQDLDPGFRGLHIHQTGECETQSTDDDGEVGDFNSAGGHLPGDPAEDAGGTEDAGGDQSPEQTEELQNGEETEDGEVQHPQHAGDLPNLLIDEDGDGVLTTVTDRLTEQMLTEEDGTAVIIHSDADNHGNLPERYAPEGPDEDTLNTGDAGDRTACGVVEPQ